MKIRTAGGSKDDKGIGWEGGREGGRREVRSTDVLEGKEEGKEGVRKERKGGLGEDEEERVGQVNPGAIF